MQGLVVCQQCGRAYCGNTSRRRNKTIKDTIYKLYRCTGSDSARFGGNKLCHAKQVGAHAIETVVWEEVKKLLKEPDRLHQEYQRRLEETKQPALEPSYEIMNKQRQKLEKGIELLIDSYARQYITQAEFEPRIKSMRQKLQSIQEQQKKLVDQKNSMQDFESVITSLNEYLEKILLNL